MNVKEYLNAKGVPFEVLQHEHCFGAKGLAESLAISHEDIAKPVLLRADGGFAYVLAIVPGDSRVDLGKVSQTMQGSRLQVADLAEVADHCPDCEPGVLPPFGSAYDMETLVDESLARGEHIVFAANNRSEAIRMRYSDFAALEQPLVGKFAAAESVAT